jgi:hypothetical protein
MPEGRRFSGERAREMQRRSVQKRLENRKCAPDRENVLAKLQFDVISALAAKARQGNAPAAKELREWLVRWQPSAADDIEVTSLEDMTHDEQAYAKAWVERELARRWRRLEGLKAAAARAAGVGACSDRSTS